LRREGEGASGEGDVPPATVVEFDGCGEIVFLGESGELFLDGVQGRAEGVDLVLLGFDADF